MTAQEYIVEQIKTLVMLFPSIRCRYEFDFGSDTHFIEVTPSTFFDSDERFKTAETDLALEFIEQYPLEGICFISDNDALIQIESPTFESEGSEYAFRSPNAAQGCLIEVQHLTDLLEQCPPQSEFTINKKETYTLSLESVFTSCSINPISSELTSAEPIDFSFVASLISDQLLAA